MIIVSTKEVLEGLKTRLIEAKDNGNLERVIIFAEAILEVQKLLAEEHEEALRENERLERRAGRTLPQG